MSIFKCITVSWVMHFFAFYHLQILVQKNKGGELGMIIQRTKQILIKESLEGG